MNEHIPAEEYRIGPHWIPLAGNEPRRGELYWLLDTQRFRLIAHLDREGQWSGIDVDGNLFQLQEAYTHYTPIREPSVP